MRGGTNHRDADGVEAVDMHVLVLTLALLTADQIVDRHIEVRGGAEKIRAVRTLVYRGGTYREGEYAGSGDAFMAFARPYYRIVGNPEDPKVDGLEGYDGSAWEYYADPGIVMRTVAHASSASRRGTYIAWRLGELRTHGSKIERGPDETIAGRPAYRLIVTTRDGFVTQHFFDQETFLTLASRYNAPFHAFGDVVKTESRPADWRAVDGVLFAFQDAEVDLATGKVLNSMSWGTIEINRELPPSWFAPREFARTRLGSLLEHLYVERTDPAAVLWSYTDFREVYPDVDTREGIEVIGYQMVKMGDHRAAVALLEANARDYPAAPTSAFGLGRAYEAAGEKEKARAEYRRALRLKPDYKRAADALQRNSP